MGKEIAGKYYMGIDLGGTKIAAGMVTAAGEIICSARDWTRAEEGPKKVLQRIFSLVESLLIQSDIKQVDIAGVGIGAPGIVDWRHGIIRELTNLPGWKDVSIKETLSWRYGWPVVLDNDANAATWGEYLFGSGRGVEHMVYLTVSTGIGSGIIQDGRLVHGAAGVAGEVGHMILDPHGRRCNCGNRGCWETISSGTAIATEMQSRLLKGRQSLVTKLAGSGEIKAEHVFKAKELGDHEATAVIDRATYYLGIGVVNLVNILNPNRLVIGGGVANAGDTLFAPVRKMVKEMGFGPAAQTEIVPATLGGDAGVIGAAALAMS